MSLSRHACRHAPAHPNSYGRIDHVWITDDLLTQTFYRFFSSSSTLRTTVNRPYHHNHQQRRCGSSVPGPLEARRRLAKRRNMDLARLGGAGGMDAGAMAMMFGKEKPKREDSVPHPGSIGFSRDEMLLDHAEASIAPSEASPALQQHDNALMDEIIEQRIQNVHTLDGIKRTIRELSLDLRQEPGFSQLIFSYLLENTGNIEDLHTFLRDPTLNVNGSGNFLYLVEYLAEFETTKRHRHGHFTIMHEALWLGLIPPEEIGLIIKLTPDIKVGTGTLKTMDPGSLGFCYQMMWDGIEACSILDSRDLGEEVLSSWLGEIAETPPNKQVLSLGAQMIRKLVVFSSSSNCSRWAPKLIANWMMLATDPVVKGVECKGNDRNHLRMDENFRYVWTLLDLFNAEQKVRYTIEVTEFLTFSLQGNKLQPRIMRAWQWLLPRFENPGPMLSSPFWTEAKFLDDPRVSTEVSPESHGFHAHHKCLLRIWIAKTLGKEYMMSQDQATDQAVHNQRTRILNDLMVLFESLASKWDDSDIFTNLTHSFRELQLPYNSIMILAAKLKTGKPVPRVVWGTFRGLEEATMTLADVFSNDQTYTDSKPYLFSAFEKMVHNTNVTSVSFIQRGIRAAEDNVEGRSALLRLFRRHTPLKIALAMAWNLPETHSPPEWSEMTNLTPSASSYPSLSDSPTDSTSSSLESSANLPSPAASLELFHLLALTFACSKRLTPRTSYRLVYWCYLFLVQHQAPIKPVIARAIYHSGVTRYREEGWKVTEVRFRFVLGLVRKVEGDKVADWLLGGGKR